MFVSNFYQTPIYYAGIDYGMRNPAMVIYETTSDTFEYFYMSTTESKLKSDSKLFSALIDVRTTVDVDIQEGNISPSIERFQNIANFFLGALNTIRPKIVFLEGYSLGSQGKVFSIAENTAILKSKLYDAGYRVEIYPPTVIKKFATGKGNASKQMMKDVFFENEKRRVIDLKKISHYKESPLTDMIDAYYVLRYGRHIVEQECNAYYINR